MYMYLNLSLSLFTMSVSPLNQPERDHLEAKVQLQPCIDEHETGAKLVISRAVKDTTDKGKGTAYFLPHVSCMRDESYSDELPLHSLTRRVMTRMVLLSPRKFIEGRTEAKSTEETDFA